MNLRSPYTPPGEQDSVVNPSILFWIAGCVFGSMAIGSLFGLLIGVFIGKFAPGYYRTVFRAEADPAFDPMSVGIGLGLTQGAAAGTVVGFLSVVAYFWIRSCSKVGCVKRND